LYWTLTRIFCFAFWFSPGSCCHLDTAAPWTTRTGCCGLRLPRVYAVRANAQPCGLGFAAVFWFWFCLSACLPRAALNARVAALSLIWIGALRRWFAAVLRLDLLPCALRTTRATWFAALTTPAYRTPPGLVCGTLRSRLVTCCLPDTCVPAAAGRVAARGLPAARTGRCCLGTRLAGLPGLRRGLLGCRTPLDASADAGLRGLPEPRAFGGFCLPAAEQQPAFCLNKHGCGSGLVYACLLPYSSCTSTAFCRSAIWFVLVRSVPFHRYYHLPTCCLHAFLQDSAFWFLCLHAVSAWIRSPPPAIPFCRSA